MDETVDAAPYSRDPPSLLVVGEKRRRITCGGGLASGEQGFLGGSDIIERVPIGVDLGGRGRARNSNLA
jgi:hypothetical protein